MVIKACVALKTSKVNSNGRKKQLQSTIMLVLVVAVAGSLVVPVLKFTDAMSLSQIGGSVRDLAGRAKKQKLLPTEMEGSFYRF
jgi:pyruvate dehydrogenase E2 component (dihydrolipoamide acetyltransferase)